MKNNTIITLDDNTKYTIVDKVTKNKKNYYFAINLDKDDNPTIRYEIFEYRNKYINILEDNEFKEMLMLDFINNYIKEKED